MAGYCKFTKLLCCNLYSIGMVGMLGIGLAAEEPDKI